jgi:hypothetical protein
MLQMRVLPVAAVVGLLACTAADVLRLDPSVRPQTSPQSIRLIAQEPTQPYKVVAIVSARGEGDVRGRLIKEAAKLGGHAILLDNGSLTRVGGDESSTQQLTGKVIVYTDSTGSH